MFKKILIANRGEIACRIASTCKKMGIKTVGIYSDADRNSIHLKYMNEAYNIGPAESSKSYLNIKKIIEVAKLAKVDAVHPGYGFLSENSQFCLALNKSKIQFIGPSVEAIKSMGDKIISKKIAKNAGVNIIPGTKGAIKDLKGAIEAAKKIGFPLMIKASAGGGGKGMRVANNLEELKSGFQSAKNEAKNSFGDDRVFVEKFIEGPRHIEIQILIDNFGNAIYLGERECSVQRRHQKIIEECPSPLVDKEMRKKMGEQAIRLAKAVNYTSAGTVEFVASNDKSFYFLEMNTRLQVEHPVTEMVTGIDIVENMINIAANKSLKISQNDIKLNGWSIEARVYAEDPIRNFAPSVGRVKTFIPPKTDNQFVRLDSGVEEGGEISMYYDPMIAKLITHGKDRKEACSKLSEALDSFVIKGLNTNTSFVNSVITNDKFRSGNITTAFLDQEYPKGYDGSSKDTERQYLIALAAMSIEAIQNKRNNLENKSFSYDKLITIINKDIYEFEYKILSIRESSEHKLSIKFENKIFNIIINWHYGSSILNILINGHNYIMQIFKELVGYKIKHAGFDLSVIVQTESEFNLSKLIPVKENINSSKILISPMPGRVVKVCVVEGQEITQGDDLIILDAMKMENILKAEKNTKVLKINVNPEETVFVDQELIEFE